MNTKDNEVFSSGENTEKSGLSEARRKKINDFRLELNEMENEHTDTESKEISSSYSFKEKKQINNNVYSSSASFETKSGNTKSKSKRLRNKKNAWLYMLSHLVIIALISVALSIFLVHGIYDMLGAYKEEATAKITIKPTTSLNEVVDQLYDNKIIDDKFFFKLYFKLTKSKFAWGDYTIPSGMDYEALIVALNNTQNRIDTVRITFPEGSSAEYIADQLETQDVCGKEAFLKVLNKLEYFQDYYFVKELPEQGERVYQLEGYLFPDTYDFFKYEEPVVAVKRFLNNYNNKITREMLDVAKAQNMTMDEMINLAAIIQREVGNNADMKLVSSVFHNRLEKGMMLQSNATDYYPYTEDTIPAGYADTNPYDTYKIKALPPGAICNPGLDAIRAALYPSKSDYFYFYSDSKGVTHFAKTLAQHENNIATYR